MTLDRTQIIKLIGVVILIGAAVILGALTNNLNHASTPVQPNEEDPHHSHTVSDSSQLVISGGEKITEYFDSSIANTIATQLYAAHYEKSSKLEREAELTDFTPTGSDAARLTIKFQPSGDTLSALVTVNNRATHDFDIKIEGGAE